MRRPPDRCGYACAMLHLASQSPRRRELLAQSGVPFEVVEAAVRAGRGAGGSVRAYVERVGRAKARAGLQAVLAQGPRASALGADTEVVLDDRVCGKPKDAAAAAAMLRAWSGREHAVI